jgi:hypothetical protein
MKNIKTYKVIAILWAMWSLLHILPGVQGTIYALGGDISSIQFLHPETHPAALTNDYPKEVSAVLVVFGQHNFNLVWFGLVTLICSVLIWKKQNKIALLVAAIVAGLADLGALFATFMIGSIDVWGILIFLGTFLAIFLSYGIWKTKTIK